jgi:hypothetical protein
MRLGADFALASPFLNDPFAHMHCHRMDYAYLNAPSTPARPLQSNFMLWPWMRRYYADHLLREQAYPGSQFPHFYVPPEAWDRHNLVPTVAVDQVEVVRRGFIHPQEGLTTEDMKEPELMAMTREEWEMERAAEAAEAAAANKANNGNNNSTFQRVNATQSAAPIDNRARIARYMQATESSVGIYEHQWSEGALRFFLLCFFADPRKVLQLQFASYHPFDTLRPAPLYSLPDVRYFHFDLTGSRLPAFLLMVCGVVMVLYWAGQRRDRDAGEVPIDAAQWQVYLKARSSPPAESPRASPLGVGHKQWPMLPVKNTSTMRYVAADRPKEGEDPDSVPLLQIRSQR